MDSLAAVSAEVVRCRRCPRLVAWREQVAHELRPANAGDEYWGRPVPGFGDPTGAIMVVGLEPATHGAKRKGRAFTGDHSGDWLFAAMHGAGLASQPTSTSVDDGLRLRDAYVTSVVRCAPPANRPDVAERAACAPYLHAELQLVEATGGAQGVVCLGAIAFEAVVRHLDVRPRPRFGHGMEVDVPAGPLLIGSYHPSQQNTFTGRLTRDMLASVFTRAVAVSLQRS
ncbi:hypothetical protein BH24ACT6_BH24ACT6_04620 [soil metagenome]